MFWPLILIYKGGNFVYHHWACKSIYRPLSYPLRSHKPFSPFFYLKSKFEDFTDDDISDDNEIEDEQYLAKLEAFIAENEHLMLDEEYQKEREEQRLMEVSFLAGI